MVHPLPKSMDSAFAGSLGDAVDAGDAGDEVEEVVDMMGISKSYLGQSTKYSMQVSKQKRICVPSKCLAVTTRGVVVVITCARERKERNAKGLKLVQHLGTRDNTVALEVFNLQPRFAVEPPPQF